MRRTAFLLGLLVALLSSVLGCATFTEPPVKSLGQWERDDAAVRSRP